jgi:hypothetical protein
MDNLHRSPQSSSAFLAIFTVFSEEETEVINGREVTEKKL